MKNIKKLSMALDKLKQRDKLCMINSEAYDAFRCALVDLSEHIDLCGEDARKIDMEFLWINCHVIFVTMVFTVDNDMLLQVETGVMTRIKPYINPWLWERNVIPIPDEVKISEVVLKFPTEARENIRDALLGISVQHFAHPDTRIRCFTEMIASAMQQREYFPIQELVRFNTIHYVAYMLAPEMKGGCSDIDMQMNIIQVIKIIRYEILKNENK
jgi:hypothetical protein